MIVFINVASCDELPIYRRCTQLRLMDPEMHVGYPALFRAQITIPDMMR